MGLTAMRQEAHTENMGNKTGRVTARVDESTAEVFEELKGLGFNVSELVRELLYISTPALQGLVKAARAKQMGKQINAEELLGEMLSEGLKRVGKT